MSGADFSELNQINPDIYAWIIIPGTNINYPILQSTEEEGEDCYLNHNLDGSVGLPGCIYTQRRNSKDFTDPNTVIYGHNMLDGTMFRGLHKYEVSDFWREHPYIYILLPDGELVYYIFAVYEADNVLLLEQYDDFRDQEVYQSYLEGITAKTLNRCYLVDETVELSAKDHIVTLCTCTRNDAYRLVVQGKLMTESGKIN